MDTHIRNPVNADFHIRQQAQESGMADKLAEKPVVQCAAF